jgi:rubrerythrin
MPNKGSILRNCQRETNSVPSIYLGGVNMTVQKDLQKAIAAAESAKGTYASFAQATDDQSAQQMFNQMSQDMDNHISQLQSRLNYTNTQTSASNVVSARNNTETDYQ